MNRELSIIIPTLDEQDNILSLIEKLQKALNGIDWEVIFVDDNSKDATSDVIEKISKKDNRIHLLKRLGRCGLSSAAIEGLHQSQAPFLAVMDADLQHDEALLGKMVHLLKSEPLDVVIASRYVENAKLELWSKGRILMSRVATGFVRIVSRVNIKDPLSGFFMMKKEFFDQAAPSLCGRGQKILLDLYLSSPDKVHSCL